MALTNKDVSIILGMAARGDKKHDIAAWFGENQARIAEAEAGDYGNFAAAPPQELPPRGAPGVKGKRLRAFVEKALGQLEGGNAAEGIATLKAGLAKYNTHET